ncbi:MAG: TetR/AcrR family transcriptional regulator [Pirellulales bacterium]
MSKLATVRRELLSSMMKEAIYEAAVSVLAEHGVEGMTMDRVAVAANVAKGSLYSYFDGKRELLEFVHARIVDPMLKAGEETIHADLPVVEKLERILHVVFDQLARNRGLSNLLMNDGNARVLLEPTARTNRGIAIGQFAVIFRQGIDEGLFRALDPTQLAEMFFGAMANLWQRSLAADTFRSTDELIEPLVSVFLNGIAVGECR